MTSDRQDGIQVRPISSEVVQLVADCADTFPDNVLVELRTILGDSIANPSPASRRRRTLGLLIDLIREGQGEFPGFSTYEAAREARFARGETWPDSTLSRLYFGWAKAVKVAARYRCGGTAARVPSSYRRRYNSTYTEAEVLRAIRRCARKQGSWPTNSEFAAFCATEHLIAHRAHKPPPRAPVLETVRRLFDNYDAALAKAKEDTPVT